MVTMHETNVNGFYFPEFSGIGTSLRRDEKRQGVAGIIIIKLLMWQKNIIARAKKTVRYVVELAARVFAGSYIANF